MKLKKFMKKEVTLFGKTMPAFVLLILVGSATTGMAALVGYISNTITADIEVSSPMLVGVSLGKTSWATTQCKNTLEGNENYNEYVDSFPECDIPDIHDWTKTDWTTTGTLEITDIHGGETVTLYTMSENLADVLITGFEKAIVTNPLGVTCDEFESVRVRTDSIYGSLGYGTEHELIGIGGYQQVNNDPNRVQFGSLENSDWNVEETDVSEMVVTFKTAASGTYTFTYQVIPAI